MNLALGKELDSLGPIVLMSKISINRLNSLTNRSIRQGYGYTPEVLVSQRVLPLRSEKALYVF